MSYLSVCLYVCLPSIFQNRGLESANINLSKSRKNIKIMGSILSSIAATLQWLFYPTLLRIPLYLARKVSKSDLANKSDPFSELINEQPIVTKCS